MTYIMGKTRKDIIETLLKLGETVIEAKAEIIYAVKRGWFPHLTTEEIMEEIKKNPEAYEHYRAGLIKIVEIKESKLSECCPICDGTGTNTHVERDRLGTRKFVEYPCQCQKESTDDFIPIKSTPYWLIPKDVDDFFRNYPSDGIRVKYDRLLEKLPKKADLEFLFKYGDGNYEPCGHDDDDFNDLKEEYLDKNEEVGEKSNIKLQWRDAFEEAHKELEASDSKPSELIFMEGNCIYKMKCQEVSETCHLDCERYHKFDLREFIDFAYKPKEPTEDLEIQNKLWNLTKPSAQYRLECNKCELYGECDHQGAYQKDGKWCYEDEESIIGTGCIEDQSEFNKVKKWENKKD